MPGRRRGDTVRAKGPARAPVQVACVIALACTVLYELVIVPLGWGQRLRVQAYDHYYRWRLGWFADQTWTALDQLVMVTIDEESSVQTGVRFPWDRAMIAALVERISAAAPRAVLLDMHFAGRSPHAPEQDARLESALRTAGNVIIGSTYSRAVGRVLPYEPFIRASRGTGLINRPVDSDGVVRRTRAFVPSERLEGGRPVDTAIEIGALAAYWGVALEQVRWGVGAWQWPDAVPLARRSVPVDRDGSLVLEYLLPPERFTHIPAWQVLQGQVAAERLRDKLVVVGDTAPVLHDYHATPIGVIPGVTIVANQLLALMEGAVVWQVPPVINWCLVLGCALLAALAGARLGIGQGLALVGGMWCGVWAAGLALFLRHTRLDVFGGLWVPMVGYAGSVLTRYSRMAVDNVRLQRLAETDELTGLYVKRYFQPRLAREMLRARERGLPLSLAIVDLDYFKRINDTHGHAEGDFALQQVAQILKSASRSDDVAVRYGGDEFCLILPDAGADGARLVIERLRQRLAESVAFKGKPYAVTLSIGVVSWPVPGVTNPEALFACADRALYEAKEQGRNRAVYARGGSI